MKAHWIGSLAAMGSVLLLWGLTRLPYGLVAVAVLAGAMGWLLGALISHMRHQADHDELTGMSNRRSFRRSLAIACRQKPVSLLFIEMDDFGLINKQYGHLLGDQALLFVCRMLEQNTRRTDLLARWGGDEFVLLLPHTDADSAMVLAERIRATVAATPFRQGAITIPLSVSTGVASLTKEGGSPEELFRRAEEAHRIAKQQKNTVCLCS